MIRLSRKSLSSGFTIVELLIVIVILGILAALVIIGYNGVTGGARDKTVMSDIDGVETEITRYSTNNNGALGSAVVWYSGGSPNANIDFIPSTGNVIDISANTTDYCIRVYNPAGTTYNNLYSAAVRESDDEVCDDLFPSSAAVTANAGAGNSLIRSIPAGAAVSTWCSLSMGGSVKCWGLGTSGELGNAASANSSTPVSVSTAGVLSGKTVKKIDGTCVIASDNNAYCWGLGTSGQLGNAASSNSSIPVAVSTAGVLSGKTIKKIVKGSTSNHTCVIASDDNAYCWGNGANGRLGNSSTSNSSIPVAVSTAGVLSGKTIQKIVMGSNHTCAIASDDNAYCWGTGANGQLGNGSTSFSSIPVAVSTAGVLSGKTIQKIVNGANHMCVIASDDKAYCWGAGTTGQLGNGVSADSSIPVAVSTAGVLSGKTITDIKIRANTTCALTADSKVYCWGTGTNGQLGNAASSNSSSPVAVSTAGVLSGKAVKQIINAGTFACALSSDGKVYCWGSGTSGQLGNGSSADSSSPVAVSTSGVLSGKTVKKLVDAYEAACAITTEDKVYCWGAGTYGELGNGASANSNVPVLVIGVGP